MVAVPFHPLHLLAEAKGAFAGRKRCSPAGCKDGSWWSVRPEAPEDVLWRGDGAPPETRRAAVDIHDFDARPRRRGRPGGRDRGRPRCQESYHQGQRWRPGPGSRRRQPPNRLPTARGKVVSSSQRPADAPKKPYPPQEQQYEGDAGLAPRNSPRRDFETNAFPAMERRCAPQVVNSAYFGRSYPAGLTVIFSGDGPLRTSLNGVRPGYWRVRGRRTKRFGPALVPGLLDSLTRCLSEERLCSSRAAPPGSIS